MRRVALVLAGTIALTMMSVQPVLLALGDIQVTLTCSDGVQFIETTLVVGPETLTALKSAVEAMTLYPAGQVCRLSQAPLLLGWLPGGLIGPLVAFAQERPKDFVVGGGRREGCMNFSISAHSDAADTPGSARGSITLDIPESCGGPAGFKAEVVCLAVSGNMARIAATYRASHGSFSPDGHIEAIFVDEGNPAPGGPGAIDRVGIGIVSDPAPTTRPCGSEVIPDIVINNGNVSVHAP
jgi:hypothetical protein